MPLKIEEEFMKKISSIESFGSTDADNDSILFDCFEEHEAFIELKNFSKFLVVGRKGSGKTAIFRKMTTIKEPNHFCLGYTFANNFTGGIYTKII